MTAAIEAELASWIAQEAEVDIATMTRICPHSGRREKVTRFDYGYITGHIEGLCKALRLLETGDTHNWEYIKSRAILQQKENKP